MFSNRYLVLLVLYIHLNSGIGISQEPNFPDRVWEKSSPESVGWSTSHLNEADQVAKTIGTDSYLVIYNGKIVHEYGNTSLATNIHSVRKSVLGILFGIYVDRGIIELDKSLEEMRIDDKDRLTKTEKKATIQFLLQSRSGVYHPSAYFGQEKIDKLPARGTFLPGEYFKYNNWDFNVLGNIFYKITKKTVFDSLRHDLAVPLKFEDFIVSRDTKWVYDRSLSNYPAYEMRLSTRDMGRIGLLMARNGRWKNTQLISEKWIADSITPYSLPDETGNGGIGYGYLWWIGINGIHFGHKFPVPVFSARGNHGQFILVDPSRDVVIVHKVNSSISGHEKVDNQEFSQLIGKILLSMPSSLNAISDTP